jgi:hypothetical protein
VEFRSNRISVLIREGTRKLTLSLSSSTPRRVPARTQKYGNHPQPKKEASEETRPADTMVLAFQIP